MIQFEIQANITPSKLVEFNQSKMSFILDVMKMKGYAGFTEKQADHFWMIINWDTNDNLNDFLKSDSYKFFHGAVITLGKKFKARKCS